MPTSYNAVIPEGATFEQFALRCARAFGYLIDMRDEPMDAPIPETFTPSTYYTNSVKWAEERLAALESLTLEEAQRNADNEKVGQLAECARAQAKEQREQDAYKAMLAQVLAWDPPTSEHVALKTFMREQIEMALRDPLESGYWAERRANLEATVPDGATWLAERITFAREQVVDARARRQKEVESLAATNAWVRQLRDSLAATRV